jgi:hypothetical protein
MLSTWIAANPGTGAWILVILAVVIAVDHALASSGIIKANSTGQAVLGWIGQAATWLQTLLSPPPPSAGSPPTGGASS